MTVPLPCEFGEIADCKGKLLPLKGVSWFRWSQGMEYTYFFARDNFWHETDFYTTFQPKQLFEFEIPDSLLIDTYMKDHGFPLKGRGYASGINYKDGKTYIDFIMTSNYLAHIKAQCDCNGKFVYGGDIIFPPSWDTEEKIESAMLKAYKKADMKQEKKPEKKQEFEQLSLFDFPEVMP